MAYVTFIMIDSCKHAVKIILVGPHVLSQTLPVIFRLKLLHPFGWFERPAVSALIDHELLSVFQANSHELWKMDSCRNCGVDEL